MPRADLDPTRPRGREPEPAPRDRRRDLVRGARQQIAEGGFEGLRVRAIAAEAELNHATLLYYFPTKEALVAAVVDDLLQDFKAPRVPRPPDASPLGEIRIEFEDLRVRLRESPDMFTVFAELLTRSRRDRAVAEPLDRLFRDWHHYLTELFRRGIASGEFRADLNPEAAARALIVQFEGLGLQVLTTPNLATIDAAIETIAAQMERWLRE